MKKRNYLGTFVYYYNILNYVISDMLSQWDLAIDAKITFGKNIPGHYDKKRLKRDSLWGANNHSIAIIGVLSAPIALLFMVLVSLFLGHKIMACYIVLIFFVCRFILCPYQNMTIAILSTSKAYVTSI